MVLASKAALFQAAKAKRVGTIDPIAAAMAVAVELMIRARRFSVQ
jgi:hypothetical protein